MIDDGWSGTIFASEFDEAFPAFARLAQRALNSAKNCRQTIGEIEMACQLADFHMAAVDGGADNPLQIAIDAAQESVGSSFGYCNVLLEFITPPSCWDQSFGKFSSS